MSSLVDFLQSVGKDADLEAEFEKDPDAVMDRYGLSDEEKEAVKSGDLDRVRAASGLEQLGTSNKTIKSYD